MSAIYDADGFLDRQRMKDELNDLLRQVDATVKVPGWPVARDALLLRLTDLLDEVAEGFAANPLDAPDMTREYINTCRPVWSSTPPLRIGEDG